MSYKLDGRRVCFTLEGIILAINSCNGAMLNKQYYIDMNQTDATEIEDQIYKRRQLYREIVHEVNTKVLLSLMQGDKSEP